nr:LL-diaminopimelate aminotransferase [Klebsiella pneumoniae]
MIDSLQSAIHRRENHGYPSFWGKPQVREAIARFYRRQYDVELDPHSEVAVFQGRISV